MAQQAQQFEPGYPTTPYHLYRTTSNAALAALIDVGSIRNPTDITVRFEEDGGTWIETERRGDAYKGYSLCPQFLEGNPRVRRAEAGQENKGVINLQGKQWNRGYVFRLPAGTPLAPINFRGYIDSATHHTLFPSARVPVVFQHLNIFSSEAISSLPWVQEEGIFFIKANADIPDHDEAMDPETYDLLFALHRAFDLLSDAAGTDLAVDMQVRIIEAGIPPLSQLGEELLTQCCDLLRSAGIEPESMFELLLSVGMHGYNLDCSIATAGARTEATETTSSSVEGLSSIFSSCSCWSHLLAQNKSQLLMMS
jgi:hypothetical protein